MRVGYGFESASPQILKNIEKKNTVDMMEKAVLAARKAKLDFIASFQVGSLGETKEMTHETVSFIQRMRLTNDKFFFTTPYPGTSLYELARAQGRIKTDEDNYIEQLGEMAETMLVNVSNMSDEELIQVKLEAEEECRRNRTWDVRLRVFMREWQRRFGQAKITLEFDGAGALAKDISLGLARKLGIIYRRAKPRHIRRYIPRSDLSEVTFNA